MAHQRAAGPGRPASLRGRSACGAGSAACARSAQRATWVPGTPCRPGCSTPPAAGGPWTRCAAGSSKQQAAQGLRRHALCSVARKEMQGKPGPCTSSVGTKLEVPGGGGSSMTSKWCCRQKAAPSRGRAGGAYLPLYHKKVRLLCILDFVLYAGREGCQDPASTQSSWRARTVRAPTLR
jgi:hypothetical protein